MFPEDRFKLFFLAMQNKNYVTSTDCTLFFFLVFQQKKKSCKIYNFCPGPEEIPDFPITKEFLSYTLGWTTTSKRTLKFPQDNRSLLIKGKLLFKSLQEPE